MQLSHAITICAGFIATAAWSHPPSAHDAGHAPQIVAPGEGRDVPVPFHETRLLLSGEASEGGVAIYEFDVPAGTAGAPPHVHANEDEYAYILDGDLSMMIGETIVSAGPGTLVAMTRNHVHAFWNDSEAPARALFLVSGDGQFEQFFDAVAVALREERPAGPEAAGAIVARLGAEHDITVRMDALPDELRGLYGVE